MSRRISGYQDCCWGVLVIAVSGSGVGPAMAQSSPPPGPVWQQSFNPAPIASPQPLAQQPPTQQDVLPDEPDPLPDSLPLEPPSEDLLQPRPEAQPPSQEIAPPDDGATLVIERFQVVGSTVFSPETLAQVTEPYTNRPVTFAEILEARTAVTQLYLDNGYITSGAILPPQPLVDGVLKIQVIEGRLEDIKVTGTRRLHPSYISSRLAIGAQAPLNVNRLLNRLQLLQLDPLIETISADLQAGIRPGTNFLVVSVVEADSFDVGYTLDNNRSPAVGSLRHQVELREGNVSGFGDRLSFGYTSTSGSKGFDLSYTLPISPDNTTLAVDFTTTDSEVIEDPFDVLDISADSGALALTLRHPLIETATREVALGLEFSRQRTQTFLGIADIGGFPLSRGADEEGQTVVSSLGFFQEWTQRSPEHVLAVRSQFNLGLDLLGATINASGPDSRFFSWQGQAQWVRLLAPDTLLLLKGGLQLTPDSLLGLEQIGLGGQSTVRGYRQDELLTDNGALASLEVRIPVYRNPDHDALLQVVPFIDMGYGWNAEDANPDTNFIAGLGAGLLLQMDNHLRARLDIGFPLAETETEANSLQERGVYFTIDYAFF